MRSLLALGLFYITVSINVVSAQTLVLSDAFNPSLSPDATELVCSSEIGVLRVSTDGSSLDTLVLSSVLEDNGTPIWHPGGQSVIYLHRQLISPPYEWEIALYDLGSGSTTVSWPAPGLLDDFGISFYADSSEVLFNDSSNQVWALNVDNGNVRPFLDGLNAMVSPDGGWVAYLTNFNDLQVVVEPINGGQSDTLGTGGWIVWTSDSQYVLYTNNSFDLTQVARDGSSSKTLMSGAQWYWAGSHVLTTLAFTRCEGESGSCSVWVTDLDPASPTSESTWGGIKSIYR